jgi:hypothetical protein
MPDIFSILRKWWKMIVGITVITTIVAAIFLSFLPKQYLSVVTALPASNVESDKARIFNGNIETLYPNIGTPDDLDKVIGTSKLDTLYYSLVRKHNLVSYYHYENIKDYQKALYKAMMHVKSSTSVGKSEYGELKIKCWDGSPHMAATLANSLFSELQELHQQLENRSNAITFLNLQTRYKSLQKSFGSDSATSLPVEVNEISRKNRQEQIAQYEKLISEYQLMIDANPQVLLLVEAGRPAVKADKPNWTQLLFLTFFAALLFALALAILLETTKRD